MASPLSSSELAEIIEKLDENEDGEIQFEEFLEWWDKDDITSLYEEHCDDLKALFSKVPEVDVELDTAPQGGLRARLSSDFTSLSLESPSGKNQKEKLPPLARKPSQKFLEKMDRSPKYLGRRRTWGSDNVDGAQTSQVASRIEDLLNKYETIRKHRPNFLEALSPTTAAKAVALDLTNNESMNA